MEEIVNGERAAWLAGKLEEHGSHLRGVAYRMLGSLNEADDAVQEAWLRLSRFDASTIENLGGWLTTVVARVCLDMLRSRTSRREEALDTQIREPLANRQGSTDPEQETLLADSVGLALLIVVTRLCSDLHRAESVSWGDVIGNVSPVSPLSNSRSRQ